MMRPPPYLAALAFVLFLAGRASAQGAAVDHAQRDEVIVRFQPGAILQGPTTMAAHPSTMGFRSPGTAQILAQAGVISLQRLFPDFTSVNSKNLLGEDILLDDLSQVYVAKLQRGKDWEEAASLLETSPDVFYADPNRETEAFAVPNDTHFNLQWWARNTGQVYCGTYAMVPDVDINAPEAWDIATGNNTSVRVGVLDTGIQSNHPDLLGRVVLGASFVPGTTPADDNGHGTACAGIVAATGNNGTGTAGVTWGTTVVSVKVLDAGGGGQWSWLAQGLDWARTQGNIPILNISLGGSSLDATVRTACKNAFLSGQLLSTAMGNNNSGTPSYPAAFSASNYSVGAIYGNGARWRDSDVGGCFLNDGFGSNTGSWIDVSAPGGRMISTTKIGSDYYDFVPCTCPNPTTRPDAFGGTSAATPVVAGVGALLRVKYPTLLAEDIEEFINRTARDVTSSGLGWDQETGYGLVRADAALNFLADPRKLHQAQSGVMTDTGWENVGPMTFFNVPGMANGVYYPRRHRMRSTMTFGPQYLATPDTWVRSSGTIGWTHANPYDYNVQVPGGSVISAGTTSCLVETFVYEVYNIQGAFVGWFPTTPSGARVAISAVGPARDVTAPAAVTNLAFTVTGTTTGTVSWTAPGDDGSTGTATSFDLRYSTAPINSANFGSATPWPTPAPGPAGTPHSVNVTGLNVCTRYYWAIKTSDEVPNVSAISNLPNAVTQCIPPAAVTDLIFAAGQYYGIVAWTAPGDDGNVGQAVQYDLRYSSNPIYEWNFAGATSWPTNPPQPAGSPECVDVYPLSPCSPYYWALKTRDDEGAWSAISNVAYAVTRCSHGWELLCAGAQPIEGPQSPDLMAALPTQLSIGALTPNPASDVTGMELAIPITLEGTPVDVSIFDVTGRRVRVLQNGAAVAGRHHLEWDLRSAEGTRVHKGVYFMRINIGEHSETRKLLLVR